MFINQTEKAQQGPLFSMLEGKEGWNSLLATSLSKHTGPVVLDGRGCVPPSEISSSVPLFFA